MLNLQSGFLVGVMAIFAIVTTGGCGDDVHEKCQDPGKSSIQCMVTACENGKVRVNNGPKEKGCVDRCSATKKQNCACFAGKPADLKAENIKYCGAKQTCGDDGECKIDKCSDEGKLSDECLETACTQEAGVVRYRIKPGADGCATQCKYDERSVADCACFPKNQEDKDIKVIKCGIKGQTCAEDGTPKKLVACTSKKAIEANKFGSNCMCGAEEEPCFGWCNGTKCIHKIIGHNGFAEEESACTKLDAFPQSKTKANEKIIVCDAGKKCTMSGDTPSCSSDPVRACTTSDRATVDNSTECSYTIGGLKKLCGTGHIWILAQSGGGLAEKGICLKTCAVSNTAAQDKVCACLKTNGGTDYTTIGICNNSFKKCADTGVCTA